MSDQSPLSDFGQAQTERMAADRATRIDARVTKLDSLRYYAAFVISLYSLACLLGFILTPVIVLFNQQWGEIHKAGVFLVLAIVAGFLVQWVEPDLQTVGRERVEQ